MRTPQPTDQPSDAAIRAALADLYFLSIILPWLDHSHPWGVTPERHAALGTLLERTHATLERARLAGRISGALVIDHQAATYSTDWLDG